MTNYPIVHFLLLPLSAAEPVKSLSKENLQNHVNGLSIEQDTLRLFNIRKWSFCPWLKNMMHLAKKKMAIFQSAPARPDSSWSTWCFHSCPGCETQIGRLGIWDMWAFYHRKRERDWTWCGSKECFLEVACGSFFLAKHLISTMNTCTGLTAVKCDIIGI